MGLFDKLFKKNKPEIGIETKIEQSEKNTEDILENEKENAEDEVHQQYMNAIEDIVTNVKELEKMIFPKVGIDEVIEDCVDELGDLGYGPIALDEFRKKANAIIEDGAVDLVDPNVKFADEKNNRVVETIKRNIRAEKILKVRAFETYKSMYENGINRINNDNTMSDSEKEENKKRSESHFKCLVGFIDVNSFVDNAIDFLKNAGYGPKALENFKNEVEIIKIDETKGKDDDRINIISKIRTLTNKKLREMKEDKEDLTLRLEKNNMVNLFINLYKNDYEKKGTSYEEAYTENHKKGCLIAFDIKHGFINKIDEFEEVLVNYISLYGYGESACKELKEKLDYIKQTSKDTELIRNFYNVTNSYVSRNVQNLTSYVISQNFMKNLAKKLNITTNEEYYAFIKGLLSSTDDELKEKYAKINKMVFANSLDPSDSIEERLRINVTLYDVNKENGIKR